MKRIVEITFAFLLGILGATAQTNPPVTPEQVSSAMSGARTIFTRFVQERHLSLFEEPLRSEGYLCFQKPGRVRWETTAPFRSVLLSDGSAAAQFECTDGKWRKLNLGLGDALQNVVSQIAGVMDGRFTDGRQGYAVRVCCTNSETVLVLNPQNETIRKMMAGIEVILAADLKSIRRVVLRENGGDYTDIRFDEQVVNFEPPPKTFDRNAPADLAALRAAAVNR